VSGAQVIGDREQLRRVVRNLLDNAERHTRDTMTVELHEENTVAELAVVDDGPGIPDSERERIFERFSRLDEARSRDAGGTGLGLAIAREIVTAHGGTLTLADTPIGTRFVVTLPVAR
jgi:signal transduction histidine kinase